MGIGKGRRDEILKYYVSQISSVSFSKLKLKHGCISTIYPESGESGISDKPADALRTCVYTGDIRAEKKRNRKVRDYGLRDGNPWQTDSIRNHSAFGLNETISWRV